VVGNDNSTGKRFMNKTQRLIQAYKQAPWRRQIQNIGLFFAAVVFYALIKGVFLVVTSQVATYGREIQEIQRNIQTTKDSIEDKKTELALLTTSEVMIVRARDMGFGPVDREDLLYVEAQNYGGRELADFSLEDSSIESNATRLPPEFTQSLIDWASETLDYLIQRYGVPLEVVTNE
jgi:cell division protein FtsL